MSTVKKVAIIGAGASGLTAIKCCLDEGLEPVCFERMNYISGLWHYTEDVEDGQACVMKATTINSSKEMMCFSDFSIPKEYPMFMHNTYVDKYFNMYAEKHDLKKYIRFETEILRVFKTGDFLNCEKKWNLEAKDKITGIKESLVFDAVMVCTGHHANKYIPDFEGISEFQGDIIHTHEYKHSKGYEGKRVLVIGIGNSGVDTAVDLTTNTVKVYLSTRRGSWITSRMAENGAPADMIFGNRFGLFIAHLCPKLVNGMVEKNLNKRFDHKKFALQPKHPFFGAHPTVNDCLPNKIASGEIVIKPDIKCLTKTGVRFLDNTFEDIDAVVLATGFKIGFPFIDIHSLNNIQKNEVNLYKLIFPPNLENTLAIIGCVQPIGATIPISEMQSRVVTRVFKGIVKLPSKAKMWREIKNRHEQIARQYVTSQRHTIQVNYIGYMDELADMIGCKPNLLKLDPSLAVQCFFGPCTSYQYRLTGPGAWSGAREAIMTSWERTFYPLRTRQLNIEEKPSGSVSRRSFVFIGFMLLAVPFAAWILNSWSHHEYRIPWTL
ncbi:LOW QUALITY PROTEIN: hypothetical protein KUTeg_022483 [Tegillarca granosa]|uniref:Flavin-containing monooxygenase n=1 Tax=Tegillarca granosa TaxID=220873 RepID=A0ABQ9E6C9_TEGGR|nr:LOW QUALITY PROTEIN: hypothetical protein KUTeg_022483 [Tegillarca granosa]